MLILINSLPPWSDQCYETVMKNKVNEKDFYMWTNSVYGSLTTYQKLVFYAGIPLININSLRSQMEEQIQRNWQPPRPLKLPKCCLEGNPKQLGLSQSKTCINWNNISNIALNHLKYLMFFTLKNHYTLFTLKNFKF